MADLPYVVHPGNGRITPGGAIVAIDAGTLASLYGLSPSEYTLSNDFAPTAIHLVPRKDGKYKNIKRELGDNGTPYHQDYPAFMHKSRNGRYVTKRDIQPQYKDSFRDRRRRDENIGI